MHKHTHTHTHTRTLWNYNIDNICVSSTKNDFFEYDYYEDIITKFNELDHGIKESLSEFLNFDEKYDRLIYLEICNLISC